MVNLYSFFNQKIIDMTTPIFIFSLPRSGSTLLQRVLMADEKICSVAEPWLLLPQVYMLKNKGTLSEYSCLTAYKGINDFINNLPNKHEDYYQSLRVFMTDIYNKQCKNNEIFFVDKTPRYYYILDDIVKIFPEAKFIFLFRNPIHIYASILNTWGNKRFKKIHATYYDLRIGFEMLSSGFLRHKNKSLSLNYEAFVKNPEIELNKISNYLSVDINKSVLKLFSEQNTKGLLGDPTGVTKYSKISADGIDKWKVTFNSHLRKKLAISLLKKINDEAFRVQGYEKEEIINGIRNLNNKRNNLIILDLYDYFKSYFIRKMNLNLLSNKELFWIKNRFLS